MNRFVASLLWAAPLICVAQSDSTVVAIRQPPSRPASWETLLDRALQLQEQGRYDEADTAYHAALQDAENVGPNHPGIANILVNVGRLRTVQQRYPEARAAFERSLDVVEKRFGPECLEAGLILGNIAMLHHQEGHYRIAEPLYRRAIAILEKTVTPLDARTAIVKAGMAKLLLAQQRYTEAEALFEDTILVFEKTQPADRVNLAITVINLAEAYRGDGRYDKAEPLYRRALAMVAETPALSSDEIRLWLAHFPPMLRKLRGKAEAREIEQLLKSMLPR